MPARVAGVPAVQSFQLAPQLCHLGLVQQGTLGVSALSGPHLCPGCWRFLQRRQPPEQVCARHVPTAAAGAPFQRNLQRSHATAVSAVGPLPVSFPI